MLASCVSSRASLSSRRGSSPAGNAGDFKQCRDASPCRRAIEQRGQVSDSAHVTIDALNRQEAQGFARAPRPRQYAGQLHEAFLPDLRPGDRINDLTRLLQSPQRIQPCASAPNASSRSNRRRRSSARPPLPSRGSMPPPRVPVPRAHGANSNGCRFREIASNLMCNRRELGHRHVATIGESTGQGGQCESQLIRHAKPLIATLA